MGGSMYPPVEPDREFRKEVFESEKSQLASRYARDGGVASKLGEFISQLWYLHTKKKQTNKNRFYICCFRMEGARCK